ncbi:MAG: superoxide dismutase family protein [Patescibacteria group bacterium]
MEIIAENKIETMRARAEIFGEKISGFAEFVEYQIDTQILVEVLVRLKGDSSNLKIGKHAVHIHEKADCSGTFKCAGGHFDPGPAGNSDPDFNHPFHAGDLPNIVIKQQGEGESGGESMGELKTVTTRFTLSAGPLSILETAEYVNHDGSKATGTAIMIHANEDKYESGPSGSGISGGPRLACGLIKKMDSKVRPF